LSTEFKELECPACRRRLLLFADGKIVNQQRYLSERSTHWKNRTVKLSIHVKRELSKLEKNFRSGKFELQTIASMVTDIREWAFSDLTDQQISALLEIPFDVLQNDVTLIEDEKKWANEQGYFFHDKAAGIYDDDVIELRFRFKKSEFGYSDILYLLDYVRTYIADLGLDIDFLLRIPEVVLRDDVALKSAEDFTDGGAIFADKVAEVLRDMR